MRIGIDRGYATDGVDEQVVAALVEAERVLVGLGATVRSPSGLPEARQSVDRRGFENGRSSRGRLSGEKMGCDQPLQR